jgi:hypothetical protein
MHMRTIRNNIGRGGGHAVAGRESLALDWAEGTESAGISGY